MWRLTNPVFTCNLKAGKAGTFQFGQVDNTAYKDGTLWYSKVDNSTGYWGFDSTQYAVGSGSTQTNSNSDSMAIADTGSSLLFVNPAPFNAFYANVNGQTVDKTTGMTTYPCSETLPDFHVSLGTQMATIPGSMLNYMPDSNKGPNGEDSEFYPTSFRIYCPGLLTPSLQCASEESNPTTAKHHKCTAISSSKPTSQYSTTAICKSDLRHTLRRFCPAVVLACPSSKRNTRVIGDWELF